MQNLEEPGLPDGYVIVDPVSVYLERFGQYGMPPIAFTTMGDDEATRFERLCEKALREGRALRSEELEPFTFDDPDAVS